MNTRCTPRPSPHIARIVSSGQMSSWSNSSRRSSGSASATNSSNESNIMSSASRSRPTFVVIDSVPSLMRQPLCGPGACRNRRRKGRGKRSSARIMLRSRRSHSVLGIGSDESGAMSLLRPASDQNGVGFTARGASTTAAQLLVGEKSTLPDSRRGRSLRQSRTGQPVSVAQFCVSPNLLRIALVVLRVMLCNNSICAAESSSARLTAASMRV